MPLTPNRSYRLGEDSEVDPIDALNNFASDVDADIASLLGNNTLGGGAAQGMVTTIEVPANSDAWLPTGVVLNGEDALWLEVSGAVSHQAAPAPTYGPYHSGGMYLVWTLVTDGTAPVGDVAGQNDFRLRATAYRKTGELYLRARDLGSGDNQGKYIVKAHYFADPGQALAPLSDLASLAARVAALEAR